MEKVDLPSVATCAIEEITAIQDIASAVKWLFDQMPLLPSTIFGRISFRKACVFKEHRAPVPFASSEALEKYIKKV